MPTNTDNWRQWSYALNEVEILPTILGRGAFGEVRLAKWRGTAIAAKRLHCEENEVNTDTIYREVDLMSQLRHPNLLLFLGVTFDPLPVMIMELMPCSLYDVLESPQKIPMTLEEILDITLDVTSGLEYLHSHNPSLIHRDISSKNILLGGNKAKIADLGQARIFGDAATLSRQTGMPGAMAYAAPEILSGRYSEKIDIFSLGVLMVQMCCGEYPRIDKREEHVHAAGAKHSVLNALMSSMLSYQPNDRPAASQVREKISGIMDNDRYYSSNRKILPQSDIGILGYRWMNEEIEARNKQLQLALDQSGRRLIAEEQRFKSEAQRVDESKQKIMELEQEHSLQQQEFRMLQSSHEDTTKQLHKVTVERDSLSGKYASLLQEYAALKEKCTDYEGQLETQAHHLHGLEHKRHLAANELELYLNEISHLKHSVHDGLAREKQFELRIEEMQEYSSEVETRLEQVLVRWQQEKDMTANETSRCKRLIKSEEELKKRLEDTTVELDTVSFRLKQYDDLPVAEEIKIRIQDLEGDVAEQKSLKEENQTRINQLLAELEAKQQHLQETDERLAAQVELFNQTVKKMEDFEQGEINALEQVKFLEGECNAMSKTCEDNDQTIDNLLEKVKSLQLKVAQGEEALEWEKRNRVVVSANADPAVKGHTKAPSKNTDSNFMAQIAKNHLDDADLIKDEQARSSGGNGGADGDNGLLNSGGVAFEEGVSTTDDGSAPVTAPASSVRKTVTMDADRVVEDSEVSGSISSSVGPGVARIPPTREGTASSFYNFGTFTSANAKKKEDVLAALNKEAADEANRDQSAKSRVELTVENDGGLGLYDIIVHEYMKNNVYLMWRSVRALREVLIKEKQFHDYLVEHRFDKVLLLCMAEYPDSAVLQAQCLRVLAALAYGNDKMRRYLGEMGTIGVVLTAMEKFNSDQQDDEVLQLHACTTLTNMFHNSLENRARFAEAGGVDILLGMMDLYKYNSKYQRQALWAMLTLAATDEMSRLLVNQGANSAILNAMMNHGDDAAVQQFALWSICNLAVAGDDIRRRLKKSGFEELSKMAIENFPDDPEVVRHAKNTLGVLNPSAALSGATTPKPMTTGGGSGSSNVGGGAGLSKSAGSKLRSSVSSSALSPMRGKPKA